MTIQSHARWILMFTSSFCVTYVRTQLQYKKSPWSEGIIHLLSSLVIHYFAIALVAILVGAIYLAGPRWLIPRNESDSKAKTSQLLDIVDIVYLTALMGSLFVWFLMVGGPFSNDIE